MRIVLFASPGILGPFTLATLLQLNEDISYVVIPSSPHSLSSQELTDLARSGTIPILEATDLCEPSFVEKIEQAHPDLILVATFDQKIPKHIFKIPTLGTINIHSSYLPQYRGACPEFWVLRHGERETGVTFHYLTEEFDAGDIIVQRKVPLNENDTVGMVVYTIAQTAAALLIEVVELIRMGKRLPRSPQEGTVTQAPLVTASDLEIAWNTSAHTIYNLIRAGNPIGGAWTSFRGFQLKIWHAKVVSATAPLYKNLSTAVLPGTVIVWDEHEKVFVKTLDVFLELKVIQLALYYILDGWSFKENAGLQTGERLGISEAVAKNMS